MTTNNPLILQESSNSYYMKNIITDENTLLQLASQNNNDLSKVPGFNPNTIDGINIGFNMALTQVPLKTACCMRNNANDTTAKIAKVRVPLEPSTIGELKNFGFEWKNIVIPAGYCPANLYKGSDDCDTFYSIYCANVNQVFTEQFGKQVDDHTNKYPSYAPDCACYAPLAVGQESYPSGIPSACFKAGCSKDSVSSYPDPTSRNQPCNATICSSVINASNLKVEGSATINPTIVQECGSSAVTGSKVNTEGSKSSTGEIKAEIKTTLANKPNYLAITGIIICFSCCLLIIFFLFIKKKPRKV
jgi:hypothetical protein